MITIRQLAQTDDMDAVSRIYEQSWRYAYRGIIPDSYLNRISFERWTDTLKRPGLHSLLLLDGDTALGTAAYAAARMEQWKGWGELVSLYLLPGAMHQGYGKQLLAAAISELQQLQFQNIYLWVLEENRSARRFYTRFGFQESENSRVDLFDGRPCRELQLFYQTIKLGEEACV